MFYDGDMGADIRWLLANVTALKDELIGANEMKAKFEQSAAEGWANYRLARQQRDELLAAAKRALAEMCNTVAPRNTFTDSADALDAAITKAEGE